MIKKFTFLWAIYLLFTSLACGNLPDKALMPHLLRRPVAAEEITFIVNNKTHFKLDNKEVPGMEAIPKDAIITNIDLYGDKQTVRVIEFQSRQK